MEQKNNIRVPTTLLALVIFVAGLLVSFQISGWFGLPASVFWPAMVILFMIGVLFLQIPKLYLILMFFYFGFFNNGVLFGCFYLPIPFIQIMDEILLAIPLAIIVMKAINRQAPRGATFFPLIYVALALLSGKANDVPLLNVIRVTLTYGKFFIIWYFIRCIGPWNTASVKHWLVAIILYALAQFAANIVWNHGVTTRLYDLSKGTVGSAHVVGYVSAMALLLMAGWLLIMRQHRVSFYFWMGAAAVIIAYDLIFMTDTKHILVVFPFVATPFFFYPKTRLRIRVMMIGWVLLFVLTSYVYYTHFYGGRFSLADYTHTIRSSGKGYMVRVITQYLPQEVPVYLLGAGPGNFCTSVALNTGRPLAEKYLLPVLMKMFYMRGSASEGSILGSPQSDLFTLLGEFGVVTTLVYFAFQLYILKGLWRRVVHAPAGSFEAGQLVALMSILIMVLCLSFITDVFIMSVIILPLWVLIGAFWDQPGDATAVVAPTEPSRPFQSFLVRNVR